MIRVVPLQEQSRTRQHNSHAYQGVQAEDTVSCRVCVAQRVVIDIAIAIEALGIARIGHNRIGADEASQLGIIPAGVVVVQALPAGDAALVILAREALRRQAAVRPAPVGAEGIVVLGGLDGPGAVDDARRAVELVAQQVVDRALHIVVVEPRQRAQENPSVPIRSYLLGLLTGSIGGVIGFSAALDVAIWEDGIRSTLKEQVWMIWSQPE